MPRQPYVAVLTHEPLSASTALFFGTLADRMPAVVRVVSPRQQGAAALVSHACAVVFVRGLFDYGASGFTARHLHLPRYYFLDDNFVLLNEEGGRDRFLRRYTEQNVRRELAGFEGVWASSTPLVDDLMRRRLFASPRLFPPVALPAWRPESRPAQIRAAFFGGRHLHSVLHDVIVPALARLATQHSVTLIIVGADATTPNVPGLEVIHEPYHDSYLAGVRRLRELEVNILIHPTARATANNAYKIPHAVITANAIGAVPVVGAGPAYASVDPAAVLQCEDTAKSWYDTLAIAARPEYADRLLEALGRYCESAFGGAVNQRFVDELIARHGAQGALRPALTRHVVTATGGVYDLGVRLAGRLAALRTRH